MIRESYDSVIRYDSANHEFESLIYFLITRITNPNLWLFDSKTESRTRILKNKSWKPNHESESSILERTESESHTESLNQKTPNPNHRPNPRYIILTIRIIYRIIICNLISSYYLTIESFFHVIRSDFSIKSAHFYWIMTNRITNRIFFFRFFRYSNTESWTESNQRKFSNQIRIRIEYYIFLKTESESEPNLSFVDISESESDPIRLLKDKPNTNRTRIRISQKSRIRIRNRCCFLYNFANLWFGGRIIWFVEHCSILITTNW